jgi:hypothetical protein
MRHEFTDHIVCPHCSHEHRGSYDLHGDHEFDCDKCRRPFLLEVHRSVTYSTRRLPCSEGHTYREGAECIEVGQDVLDRWIAEGSAMAHRHHHPYCFWKRRCAVCLQLQYSDPLPPGAACPWLEEAATIEDPDR